MKLNDRTNLTAKLNRLIERDAEARADFLEQFKKNPGQAIARRGESVAVKAHAAEYAAACLKQLDNLNAADGESFPTWAAETVAWLSNRMVESLDAHFQDWERRNEAQAAKLVWEAFTRYL